MVKLDSSNFPIACDDKIVFRTSDIKVRKGKYTFNDDMARRWIDEDDNEFTSDDVLEWEYLNEKEGEKE